VVEGGRIGAIPACLDLTELIDIRPGVRSGKPCLVRAGLEFAALRERRLATPA
jgi:hypothetical protein